MSQTISTGKIDAREWSRQEFGTARLGNAARTRRIVKMAERMYQRPFGRVTQTFQIPAEREGAYRALENPAIDARGLDAASTRAAVRRTEDLPHVYIPIDGTSLTFLSSPAEDLGDIGNKRSTHKGLHVHHALMVGPGGEVLGMGPQIYFRRRRRNTARTREQRRKAPLARKESRFWLQCIERSEQAFADQQVAPRRCYLLDRGGDFREMLQEVADASYDVIIRSQHNRRVGHQGLAPDRRRYLFDAVHEAPVLGHYQVDVPDRPYRAGRCAEMEVRAEQCLFRLEDRIARTLQWVPIGVVTVSEISPVPPGEEPIEWRLITTRPIRTFNQALAVVDAYTYRWRIEEMHRCWKSVCRVEESRLRTAANLTKWATIMASVAARVEHLKTVSRQQPDTPAARLFSPAELKALVLLRFEEGNEPTEKPTAGKAVQWVAQLGGYVGPSNGPPGAETIARGMREVEVGATVLARAGWNHDPPWPLEKDDQ